MLDDATIISQDTPRALGRLSKSRRCRITCAVGAHPACKERTRGWHSEIRMDSSAAFSQHTKPGCRARVGRYDMRTELCMMTSEYEGISYRSTFAMIIVPLGRPIASGISRKPFSERGFSGDSPAAVPHFIGQPACLAALPAGCGDRKMGPAANRRLGSA